MAAFLQTVSVVIAALSVVVGITSWRRSELGKRRVELAEEVLETFFRLGDAFAHIRSPIGFVGEGSTRKRMENETPAETRALDNAYVAIERYEKYANTFNKAYSLRPRMRAYFGKEADDCFETVMTIRNDILRASDILSRYWRHEAQGFQNHNIVDKIEAEEDVFWYTGSGDEITAKIEDAVRKIEKICSDTLRPEPTLKSHMTHAWRGITAYLGFEFHK